MNNILINGQYQVIKILNNLNYEKTYLTADIKNNNQQYILKQYFFNNSNDEIIRNFIKFRKEINNIYSNHIYKRFPSLQEIIFLDNQVILVENIIQGISLNQELNTNNLWDESEAIAKLKYLLESLDILHNYNFIHQNIKLDNIIRLSENSDQLLIANLELNIHDNSELMMTITVEDKLYLPLEQIMGKSFPASNIYSLGMIIITMMIGNKIHDLEEEDGKLIWQKEINVSNNLALILNKMIQPQPLKRYQNVTDILEKINQLFSSQNKNNNEYNPTEIISQYNNNLDSKKTQTNIYINSSISENQDHLNSTELIFEPQHYGTVNNNEINPPTQINATQVISNSSDNNKHNRIENALLKHSLALSIFTHIKTSKKIMISLVITFLIISSTAIKTYLYERKINNIITSLENYYLDKKYNDCIVLINSAEVQSLSLSEIITQEFLDKCWLGLAETEATNNNHDKAIDIAVKISKKSPDYEKSLQYIDDWSDQIIKEATDIHDNKNNIELALEKLEKIPQSSSRRKEALDLAQQWQNGKGDKNTIINLCPGALCPNED